MSSVLLTTGAGAVEALGEQVLAVDDAAGRMSLSGTTSHFSPFGLGRLQSPQVAIEVRFRTSTGSFFERVGVDFGFSVPDSQVGADGSSILATDPATGECIGSVELGPLSPPGGTLTGSVNVGNADIVREIVDARAVRRQSGSSRHQAANPVQAGDRFVFYSRDRITLVGFNHIPHLASPDLVTSR